MLCEVVIDPQRTLFDSNLSYHHHILHTETDEIRDIPPIEIDPLYFPSLTNGEQIDSVGLVLRFQTDAKVPATVS